MAMPIKSFTINKTQDKTNIVNNQKLAINITLLKWLSCKEIRFLRVDRLLLLTYWPLQLKIAHIVFTRKSGKYKDEIRPYRPNSLLHCIQVNRKRNQKRTNQNKIQDRMCNRAYCYQNSELFLHQYYTIFNRNFR